MLMCFGFVILNSFHSQDKRLTSLLYLNPLIKIIYSFSCLCLIGLPFLRAFFSKDFIIEKSVEVSQDLCRVVSLIFFLAVRIYYSFKLLQLNNLTFSYFFIEKQNFGLLRILIISLVSILIINLYISLVFRLTLEIFSVKIFIYLVMFFFLILNLISNLNFKIVSYDKIKNWFEI